MNTPRACNELGPNPVKFEPELTDGTRPVRVIGAEMMPVMIPIGDGRLQVLGERRTEDGEIAPPLVLADWKPHDAADMPPGWDPDRDAVKYLLPDDVLAVAPGQKE